MMTTDRFKIRLTEHNTLIKGIKEDIKAVLLEKGYGDTSGYASFNFTCKPDRFKQVGIDFGQLYFVDNSNCHWHSDNVNDVNELLSILRAMYHIIAK